MTDPLLPTYSSDAASDALSRRIVRGLSGFIEQDFPNLREDVLLPIRTTLETGQRLNPEAVRHYTTRAAELLADDRRQNCLSISKAFTQDRVRRAARGEVRASRIVADNEHSATMITVRFVVSRDEHEVQVSSPRIRLRTHAIARYFRRIGRGYSAFRSGFEAVLAEACLLGPLLRPPGIAHDVSVPVAVATADGLLCGASHATQQTSYMTIDAWQSRRKPFENRFPDRFSPLLSPSATVLSEFLTFIDRDSLSGLKGRVHDQLTALQAETRPAAIMHLEHLLYGRDYDAALIAPAIARAAALRESPDWQAYVAATTATWAESAAARPMITPLQSFTVR